MVRIFGKCKFASNNDRIADVFFSFWAVCLMPLENDHGLHYVWGSDLAAVSQGSPLGVEDDLLAG